MYPTHPLAQFTSADQLDNSFTCISSDDSGEQKTFEDIFGAEFPFVKSDYPMFFVFQNEDMTIIYGSTHVCVRPNEPLDLVYFWSAETMREGAYSPYVGTALESRQNCDYLPAYCNRGFIPVLGPMANGHEHASYTETKPRFLVIRREYNEYDLPPFYALYSLERIRENIAKWDYESIFSYDGNILAYWKQVYKIACQLGVK